MKPFLFILLSAWLSLPALAQKRTNPEPKPKRTASGSGAPAKTQQQAAVTQMPLLTSAAQFATATQPACYYAGSVWNRESKAVTPTTPGYGAVLLAGPAGSRYRRQYEIARPAWWGVVGDNSADDTDELQAFFNYQASTNALVSLPDGQYKISKTLTLKRGLAGFEMSANSAIRPTGSGYTAVVTEKSFAWNTFKLKISGSGNAVNGLVLNNPQRSNIDYVRVENLNGFGMIINRGWDCIFRQISVEQCGNASNYAFSILDDGDTSNQSVFERLQVEDSKERAIYVSANSYKLTFNNVHSERANVTSKRPDTWFLGGFQSIYNNVRLTATRNTANAGARINGNALTINSFTTEDNIPVEVNSWQANQTVTLNDILINGRLAKVGNGIGIVNRGTVHTVESETVNFSLNNLTIDSLGVGFSPMPMKLTKCTIGTLYSTSNTASADFDNCTINGGTALAGQTTLIRSVFKVGQAEIAYRKVILDTYAKLVGNITLNTASLRVTNHSGIDGNLTLGAARQAVFDATSYVSGTLMNMGPPEASQYAGDFRVGERTYNPKPAPGGVEYWWCTAAGAGGKPGTWQAVQR